MYIDSTCSSSTMGWGPLSFLYVGANDHDMQCRGNKPGSEPVVYVATNDALTVLVANEALIGPWTPCNVSKKRPACTHHVAVRQPSTYRFTPFVVHTKS